MDALHNRVVMLGHGVNQKTAMLGSLHMVPISRWYYRDEVWHYLGCANAGVVQSTTGVDYTVTCPGVARRGRMTCPREQPLGLLTL